MPEPRVLILYNRPVLPPDHPDRGSEDDVLYSVKVVRDSLKVGRFPVDEYGVDDSPGGVTGLLARLTRRDYDLVFNLYEGAADRSVTEVYLAGLLEWLNVPYTGCPAHTLSLARSKPLAKRLFAAAGIGTPEFVLVSSVADLPADPVGYPAIVKPADEDASVGVDQEAVVTSDAELRARVRYVMEQYGPPVLVERYVAGRELQVSLIDLHGTGEPVMLPPTEIAFTPTAERAWPVYTYTAKWDEQSVEFKHAQVLVGVELPADLLAALEATAKRAYHTLGARDYARVDTRVTPDGRVYVLEVNPNPSITSLMIDEGLPAVGFTYDQFIAALVRNAVSRPAAPVGQRRVRASAEPN